MNGKSPYCQMAQERERKCLVVIPAQVGSRQLPRKHMVPAFGRPLDILYRCTAALSPGVDGMPSAVRPNLRFKWRLRLSAGNLSQHFARLGGAREVEPACELPVCVGTKEDLEWLEYLIRAAQTIWDSAA